MFYEQTIVIDLDSRIKLDKLSTSLVALGYERVDMIELWSRWYSGAVLLTYFPISQQSG